MMEKKDRMMLLNLARESIRTYFQGKKPDISKVKHLAEKRGVFVTLHDRHGKLRGCIGYPAATHPLYIAITEAARSAAFHDPRFAPLKEDELAGLSIEISILTLPQLIEISHYNDYAKKIELGKDGLILEGPYGSGLLLPQVATENNFNAQSYLNALSQKSGLSFNAWREHENKIYKFQAEIISEKD
jgi:uncharacterized protein